MLTIDGHSAPLNFGEIQHLIGELDGIRREARATNSVLWKEKEQILFHEDGVASAVYVRGIRQNPPRRR